jgi:uncharacterized protein YjbI with pentapeptide repeats
MNFKSEHSPHKQQTQQQALYEKARAILDKERNSFGPDEQLTQAGFLALAHAGASIWNEWRRHHCDQKIDFSCIDFTRAPVDFSGFHFVINDKTSDCVSFARSTFGPRACFMNAIFGSGASFVGAYFRGEAYFNSTSFLGQAGPFFNHCTFLEKADFSRANFESGIHCSDTAFNSIAIFFGARFSGYSHFVNTRFRLAANFLPDIRESSTNYDNKFHNACFSGAIFHDRVNFDGRNFVGFIDFGPYTDYFTDEIIHPPARFDGIPSFHDCKFNQNTNFDGAEFLAPASSETARAYRTLKLAMEQLKATREEQKFFRLEMKAEHPSLPRGKRWISTLYSLFSDYGFSLWRPASWLIGLSVMFGIGYGLLANTCAADISCAKIAWKADVGSAADRTSAVIKYTLASVSPVPGLDRMQTELRAPLFGHHGWIPITALVLEILHKIVALVMAFLFALALRNLFKMKS